MIRSNQRSSGTSDGGCRRCATSSRARAAVHGVFRWTPRLRPRRTSPAPCSRLDPAVAQLDLVLLAQLLLEMPHVQIEVPLPTQLQHALDRRQRYPLRTRPSPPSVEQPVIAMFLVTLMPTPHLSVADANDLCRLPPRGLFAIARKITSCAFIAAPLRSSRRSPYLRWSATLAARQADISPATADISCATDNRERRC